MSSASNNPSPQAIILAAGKGTRMGADQPKVSFEAAGRPLVWWVVRACRAAGVSRCIIVVGYKGEVVRRILADEPDCVFVEQSEQLGTGHATKMAAPLFDPQNPVDVFVLAGDAPLLRSQTLQALLRTHRKNNAAATLAAAEVDDPTGYGRVIRDADGCFQAIVEEKDATPEQKRIRQINPSYYCFRSDALFSALEQVKNANKQAEYYLTDVPVLHRRAALTVAVVDAVPPEDVLGVNTPQQLAVVDAILRQRHAARRQQEESV